MPSPATPILDSGVLPPRVRQRILGNFITGFLAGVVPVFLLAVVGRQANNRLPPVLDLISFVGVLALVVIVHELAHLVAGWLVGFRFSAVQVGPLSFRIEHGVLRARFRLEMTALGYAGMQVNRLPRLRKRMLVYIAAGPAANLLSVPVAVLIFNDAFPHLQSTWVATPVAQFAFLSLLLGVLSLIPRRSALMTDGARIVMLLRSRDLSRRWLSIAAIGNLSTRRVRAKNWKRTWLISAASVHDTSVDAFTGNWATYASANDRRDVPAASASLERCLELVQILPVSIRDIVAQEAAVFSAWFRRDAALANRWLTQLSKPKLMPPIMWIRLNVALSCAHSEYDAAELALREGFKFIETSTSGSARERLTESWLEWREEIRERKNNQPVAISNR